MLFKWMVCQVTNFNRNAFSNAQQHWSSIASVPGFFSQFGGWDLKNPGKACIMGIWDKHSSYQNFMNMIHDGIVEKNQQEKTYESLKVSFYREVISIPSNEKTAENPIQNGSLIRIAECTIKPNRTDHFTKTQIDVWNPGMAQVDGMLGGYFCKNTNQENRYLVMSFWRDKQSHQNYIDLYFRELRERSGVEEDVESLLGRLIELEPQWNVAPESRER